MKSKILIGAHLSISGGLEKAIAKAEELGISVLQIFTKNASTWKEKILNNEEIELFINARNKAGIDFIFSHDSYLINLASPDNLLWQKSIEALEYEFIRAISLSLDGVILHPGQYVASSLENGIDRIGEALNVITDKIKKDNYKIKERFILLETTAGQGSSIGYRFEEINEILNKLDNKELFGVCFDSAHVYAAGYNIADKKGYENTFMQFDKIIGLDKLKAFHLNDTNKALSSRVDRHEHIGKGKIGELFFKLLMNDKRFMNIPKIIETPKGDDDEFDRMNLDFLKRLVRG